MSEMDYSRHLRTEGRREALVTGSSGSIKPQPSVNEMPQPGKLKYVISSTLRNETSEDASIHSFQSSAKANKHIFNLGRKVKPSKMIDSRFWSDH